MQRVPHQQQCCDPWRDLTGHNSSVATSLQMVTWSHSNVIITRESREGEQKTLDTLAKDIQSIIFFICSILI